MLALLYISFFVSEIEKNTKMCFYNRSIPIVGLFLIEQSQEYSRCLWQLKHKMITKALNDKHSVVLESLREWTQTTNGQLMVIKGV